MLARIQRPSSPKYTTPFSVLKAQVPPSSSSSLPNSGAESARLRCAGRRAGLQVDGVLNEWRSCRPAFPLSPYMTRKAIDSGWIIRPLGIAEVKRTGNEVIGLDRSPDR